MGEALFRCYCCGALFKAESAYKEHSCLGAARAERELAAKDARIQELEGQVAILTQEKGYGIENMKLLRAEIATLMSALDEAEKVIQHLLPYAHLNTCTPKSCAVCIVADPALAKIREVRK